MVYEPLKCFLEIISAFMHYNVMLTIYDNVNSHFVCISDTVL